MGISSSRIKEEKVKTKNLKPQPIENNPKRKPAKTSPIHEWKEYLIDKVKFKDSSDSLAWEPFEEGLIKYIKLKDDSHEVGWIISAQYVSQTSANYSAQFKLRKQMIRVVKQANRKGQLQKSSSAQLDNFPMSTLNTCTSLSHIPSLLFQNQTQIHQREDLNKYNTSIIDEIQEKNKLTMIPLPQESPKSCPNGKQSESPTNTNSPQSVERNRLFSDLKKNVSAQTEFKKNLLRLLRPQDHILHGLIREFLAIFERAFKPYLSFQHTEHNQQYESLYVTIKRVVQRFTGVLENFLCWIYKDLIQNFTYGLTYEETEPKYFIQEMINELLFQDTESSLLKALLALIYIKHKKERTALRATLAQRQNDDPSSYDENLDGSYLAGLKNEQKPFSKVVSTLQKLKTVRSPFTKFQLIQRIEDEMKRYLIKNRTESFQDLQKLINNFGYDVKMPIWMYCFVQAQDEELIVHKVFIEEFVDSKTVSNSTSFLAFEGCIHHLMERDASL